jgi:hypothetical protein
VKKELAIFENKGKRGANLESCYKNLNSILPSSVDPERFLSGCGRALPKLDHLYMMRAWPAFGPGTSSERYRTETAIKLDEDYGKHVKIFTDGSKMGDKEGYAFVKEEHTIKKRILSQNTVFSAEQSAIIGAIQSEKKSRHDE